MLIKRQILSCIRSLHFSSSVAPCILKAGDHMRQTRIFSDQEVLEYSKLSQDSNPLHFDCECAQAAGFEDRVVHGMLVTAIFLRIISSYFPQAIYVSQSLHFRLPVYIGEEIVGDVMAINIREVKKRFITKFSTGCYKNNRELLVLDGEATAILPTLNYGKSWLYNRVRYLGFLLDLQCPVSLMRKS